MDLDAGAIFDRARKAADARSDAELSGAFGKSANAIATWRRRNTVPLAELVAFAKERGLSLEWLLTGEGESRSTASPAVDRHLLMSIAGKLEEAISSFGRLDAEKIVGISSSIYNRLVETYRDDNELRLKVDEEVSYAREVLLDINIQDLEALAAGSKTLEEKATSSAEAESKNKDPIERFLVAAHHRSHAQADVVTETASRKSAVRQTEGKSADAKAAKKRGA